MASILVYVEALSATPGGESPSEHSGYCAGSVPAAIAALGEGRRLASRLGAAVCALVPVAERRSGESRPNRNAGNTPAEEALIATMSRSGADRVLLARVPLGPALWTTHGPALEAACREIEPVLVLFAPTPVGRDLAPRLAAHLEAAFFDEAGFEIRVENPGAVELESTLEASAMQTLQGDFSDDISAEFVPEAVTMPAAPPLRGPVMRAAPIDATIIRTRVRTATGWRARETFLETLDRPCIATLAPGPHRPGLGINDALLTLLGADRNDDDRGTGSESVPRQGFTPLGSDVDPGGRLERARVVVSVGGGVDSQAEVALAAALARALGGELGATHDLCARGLMPAEREIGVGVRRIAPALYVTCAASGSRDHLDALGPQTAILAINADPDAPVFRVARYGIVGRVDEIIPALLSALEGKIQPSSRS